MVALILKEPQRLAIPFALEHPRCALWGSCGIGKSSSALFVADALMLTSGTRGPTLVCAPARVARDVWIAEAKKWDQFKHLRVVHIGGTPTQRVDYSTAPPLGRYLHRELRVAALARAIFLGQVAFPKRDRGRSGQSQEFPARQQDQHHDGEARA